MIQQVKNLTEISSSNITQSTNAYIYSSNRPQNQSKCLSISNLSYCRNKSIPSAFEIRENQLLWMFNRRKQKLIQTSVQNLKLYKRINNQRSSLSKFNKNRSKLPLAKIGLNLGQSDKQNANAENQMQRRKEEVNNILKKVPKEWKKFNPQILKII